MYYLSSAVSELKGTETATTLYRGQTFIPPDIEEWKVGDIKVWPAFTSCSTDRSASESFANGQIMFEITIKPDYGGFLTSYSVFPNESELLLPSFSSFEVKKITKGGEEKWLVEMDLLGVKPMIKFDIFHVVKFVIQYDTYFGQNLYLVGSTPNIGSWDLYQGKRMKCLPGNYWEIEIELNEQTVFEYKFVVVLLDGDLIVDVQRWEERENRKFDLTRFQASQKLTEFWDY